MNQYTPADLFELANYCANKINDAIRDTLERELFMAYRQLGETDGLTRVTFSILLQEMIDVGFAVRSADVDHEVRHRK